MPIAYTIDREKNCIFETWTGSVSFTDLKTYWSSYLADVEVRGIRRTLVDLRNARMGAGGFVGAEIFG